MPTPDPSRPGTVYRSRPRLLRRGSGSAASLGRTTARPSDGPEPPWHSGAGADPYVDSYADFSAAPSADSSAARPAPSRAEPTRGGSRQGSRSRGGGRSRFRPRLWVTLLLVVLVGYPALLGLLAWSGLQRVAAMPDGARPADGPGRTYLVVGSDSRADLSAADRRRLHTGKAEGQRTDTVMMLHVPDGDGPTVLVSVPRDSYVTIPGRGKNKINAAYAFGGPKLLVRTVEQATGVHIDSYVETGLGGYATLVDAIGGVRVCVKRAMNDPKAHLKVAAGCQGMDGATALAYARARYSDPLGDLGRVQRQRQVLAAIAGRTLSPEVLAQPWLAIPAARAGSGALTVDDGTSPIALARFVLAMRSVSGGSGLSLTVPIGNPNLQTPAGEAVEWDATKSAKLFSALASDRTEQIRPLAAEQSKN